VNTSALVWSARTKKVSTYDVANLKARRRNS
jgi:hypothetical protein